MRLPPLAPIEPLGSLVEYLAEIKKELERLGSDCMVQLSPYTDFILPYEGFPFPRPPDGQPAYEILKFLRDTPTEPPEDGNPAVVLAQFCRLRTFRYHLIAYPSVGPTLWNPFEQTYRDFMRDMQGELNEVKEGYDYSPPHTQAEAWVTWQIIANSASAVT